MEINVRTLIRLLQKVEQVRQESMLAARLTGENFNIFNILRLTTDEVRTHSAFIAELLNPKGSHGQETLYLDLFLHHLSKDNNELVFESHGATITVEHHIDVVNILSGTGGRIDILLSDKSNRYIVIENKINAGDQETQLLRYHNAFSDSPIYYLTLTGEQPDKKSTGDCDFRIFCISYKEHISSWLEDCYKESVELPIIRETIKQYKNLINLLTNQTTGGRMKEQAIRLILDNPTLVDAVDLLSDAWQTILERVKSRFWTEAAKVRGCIQVTEGVYVSYGMPTDCNGVVIAFRVHGEKNIHASAPEKYLNLKNILRRVVSDISPEEHKTFSKGSSFWNLGWFNAKGFEPNTFFTNIPKVRLLSYYENEGTLLDLVNKIGDQAEYVIHQLQQTIQSGKDQQLK